MVITSRPFNREDLETVSDWWMAHRGHPIDAAVLSETGIVAMIDGEMAACTWAFNPTPFFFIIGWTVSNPKFSGQPLIGAVAKTILDLMGAAKAIGCTRIVSISSSTGLDKIFSSMGFMQLEKHTFWAIQV